MENKPQHKKNKSAYALIWIAVSFLIIGIGFLIAIFLLDDNNADKSLWTSVNVIASFSFLIISLIIFSAAYKELELYRGIALAKRLTDVPLYEIHDFNLDFFKAKLQSLSYTNDEFDVIKDKAILRGNISYYFYIAKSNDINSDLIVNKYKRINEKNENQILICILDSFILKDDDYNRINAYDKAQYTNEILNGKEPSRSIMLVAYDRENKILRYFMPKNFLDTTTYKHGAKIIKNIYSMKKN